MLLAERERRAEVTRELADRAAQAEIAKLRHERFGQSSERRALLDQLELQLVELEEDAGAGRDGGGRCGVAERDGAALHAAQAGAPAACPSTCRASASSIPAPSACPCCGGALRKLGEDVTETLELVPRQWKVIQHVREKFSCRSCEKITQPPAPSHPIARGRAGPEPAGPCAVRASTACTCR